MAANPTGHSPLTPVVFHVLFVLAEGALHGYAIMQAVEENSGIEMGPGTVYGTLQRLEDRGWVREAGTEGGRRKLYAVTDQGMGALRDEALRLNRLAELTRERHLVPEGGAP